MESWEQRDDETSTAFEAFRWYRDQGPTRSIDRTWNEMRGKSGGDKKRSDGRMRAWSAEFDWIARARDYDRHLDLIRVEAERKAIEAKVEELAKRRDRYLEDKLKTGQALLDQVRDLSKFPIKDVVLSLDGKTTTITAVNPAYLKAAASIFQSVCAVMDSSFEQSVGLVKTMDDGSERSLPGGGADRLMIENAAKEIREWKKQKQITQSNSSSADSTPDTSPTNTS